MNLKGTPELGYPIDIYFLKADYQRVSDIMSPALSYGSCRIVLRGYCLNYENYLYRCDSAELASLLSSHLKEIPGIFVNCYPPEIEKELAQVD